MFPKFVVPAIKSESISANKHISDLIYNALNQEKKIELKPFGNVLKGLIATEIDSSQKEIFKAIKV